jgi:O-methyltransferase
MIKILSLSSRKKFDMRMALIRSINNLFGTQTYKSNLSWPIDANYSCVMNLFPPNTGKKILPHDRKYTLMQFLLLISNVPGHTAECGVFKGESSHIILHMTQGQKRQHYCFDSFEGLSEPSKKDLNISKYGFKWGKSDLKVNEDVVRENLKQFDSCNVLKGWIPSRFQEVDKHFFSFVHIDVDLEHPTRDSLKFFYPRINPGGIIIIDDYGFESCPGARFATDGFMKDKPEKVLHLTTGQGVIIKGLNTI